MGRAFAKHAPQAPRVGAHDLMTGLDEEGDSTDDEMPPLEPLEGAAQLGVVWLAHAAPVILIVSMLAYLESLPRVWI